MCLVALLVGNPTVWLASKQENCRKQFGNERTKLEIVEVIGVWMTILLRYTSKKRSVPCLKFLTAKNLHAYHMLPTESCKWERSNENIIDGHVSKQHVAQNNGYIS